MADSSESSPEITVWLDAARGGDREALDRVLGTLYQELHTLARRQLSGQQNNTLDPTSLVHESYLKLVGASNGACCSGNCQTDFACARYKHAHRVFIKIVRHLYRN